MRLSFDAVLRDVLLLWKQERDLLVRIAGVFFFLPLLGFGLLLADLPDVEGKTLVELRPLMLAWYQDNWPWLLGSTLVQDFGVTILFLLFLAPDRLTTGEAIRRALWVFPGFLVTELLCGLVMMAGAMLFLLPGFYACGRTLVSSAAFAANPEQGPMAALQKGFRMTTGLGWLLFGLWALVFLCGWLGVNILGGGQSGGPALLDMALRIASAAIAAATIVALTLLRIVLYRRLAGQRG